MADYVPYTWTTGDIITAVRLNNLETQYANAKTEFGAGNWTTPTLKAAAAATLSLGANAGTQWRIDTSGHLIPITTGVSNLGAAASKVLSAYITNAYCDQLLLPLTTIDDVLVAGTPNIARGTFDIFAPTGVEDVEWRLFRSTTTTGTRRLIIFKGDGTTATTFQLSFETGVIEKCGGLTGMLGGLSFASGPTYDIASAGAPIRDLYIGGKIWGSRLPMTDNVYDLGSGSFRMRHGYFGGNLYTDGYGKAAKNVMFKAYRNALQSIPASTLTIVAFNAEVFDPNGVYDSASTYTFTPPVAGTYLLQARVIIQTLATGKYVGANMVVGGVNVDYHEQVANTVTGNTHLFLSTIVPLTTSYGVWVNVYHNDTVPRNLNFGSDLVHFEAHLLSSAG